MSGNAVRHLRIARQSSRDQQSLMLGRFQPTNGTTLGGARLAALLTA
jgi:hypothetical protein